MNETLKYYDENAEEFVKNTINIDFSEIQEKFIKLLPDGGRILDLGCGSGRDARYFYKKGFVVDAVDGSAELCRLAGRYSGINVRQMLFSELNAVEEYDGIWACSSILHLTSAELKDIMMKILRALKNDGWFYASFKYGEFEGVRNGRYFTDFTNNSFERFISDISGFRIKELWLSDDARADRSDEKWLNLILRKSN